MAQTKTASKTVNPKPAAKSTRKASQVKSPPKKAAKAPKTNVHVEAGVRFSEYAGESKANNANRPVKVMVKDKIETLTERCQKSFYALRSAYGNSTFPAKGIDNGVLRDLAAAGLVSLGGGRTEQRDGKTYYMDGDNPLMVKITPAGAAYGKA